MLLDTIKSMLLLGSMSGLLLVLGYLVGGSGGIRGALVMSLLMNGLVYFFSDSVALAQFNAQELDRSDNPKLFSMTEELAHKMNIPMPKLWLLQTPIANAFATGRNAANASVAVTDSIMNLLDEDELRGVIAHELSHIKHRDILISTMAATFATAIGYIARSMQFQPVYFQTSEEDTQQHINPLARLFATLLMPVAAIMMQLSISRSREFLADESGAQYSGVPLSLASALQKLEAATQRVGLASNNTAYAGVAELFIVHPFRDSGLATLFSSHPSVEERVERLKKLAQSGALR